MVRLFPALLLAVSFITLQAKAPDPQTRLALLDLGSSSIAKRSAEKLRIGFQTLSDIRLLDQDLSHAAARGAGYSGSLNLAVEEARNIGAAIDSDFYIIGDSQTIRRSSSKTPVYYESYCTTFVVSSRTGKLLLWQRSSFQDENAKAAEDKLINHIGGTEKMSELIAAIRKAHREEREERALPFDTNVPLIEEAPDDEVAVKQGLRLPRPYRRLRPSYPDTAAVAEAEGTVDVLVDIGADGEIIKVQVARWAGFGLDDITVATVRQMHFFPAKRDGKSIPMRVLLRYNFRKPAL